MSIVTIEAQKQSTKNKFQLFFDLRIFRYSLLKQLKSLSTYVYLFITIVSNTFILITNYSVKNAGGVDNYKDTVLSFICMLSIAILPIFIVLKVLQIFNEEMDDGTLLILSSMPFSRFRLVFQKWLSLQFVCFIFIMTTYYMTPVIYSVLSGMSDVGKEILKILLRNSFFVILSLICFQLLFSSIIVLMSLLIGKVGTFIITYLLSTILGIIGFVFSLILRPDFDPFYQRTTEFANLKDNLDINKYLNDPDLEQLFEFENWYDYNESKSALYSFTYTDDIDGFNDLKTKNLKVKLNSLAVNEFKSYNLLSSLIKKDKIFDDMTLNLIDKNANENTNNNKLIKSFNKYKYAFDGVNLNQKEKKIIEFSKAIFNFKSQFLNLQQYNDQINQMRNIKRYDLKKVGNHESILKDEPVEIFIDNSAFQHLIFFMENVKWIVQNVLFYYLPAEKVCSVGTKIESFKKIVSCCKINNYLNILAQINIMSSNKKYISNVTAEWEKKTAEIEENGATKSVEYFKLKPKTVKLIIKPIYLWIVNLVIVILLLAGTVRIICRKDFT